MFSTRTCTYRLSLKLYETLQAYAKRKELTVSMATRRLVEAALEAEKALDKEKKG